MTREITPAPLTRADFAPYGTVIEIPPTGGYAANGGTALRFDDLTELVLTAPGGRPQMSLMRVTPTALPMECRSMERHPRSSQLFMPFSGRAFLVIVALGPHAPDPASLRAFRTNGAQGVNFAPGTWHHAALAIGGPTDFLVIGHASKYADCDIAALAGITIRRPPPDMA
ncbi:MAG: ureidoglycolate lyase [Rhodospirillales bacterium]|nr:ureidoglycolate lyase [Rhodospirillales bacterium]MDE2199357.1 ureidoglycolate lyase [Rhodospirillales bacterium]MDE2574053.1 ureidoglycolate lyase [Rhodospirillales bacterium]